MPASCCGHIYTCACSAPTACAACRNYATLNANYLMKRLATPVRDRISRAPRQPRIHRVAQRTATETGITAMDLPRLAGSGFHAPTTYFPLLVAECLLIEPTETKRRRTRCVCRGADRDSRSGADDPEAVKARPGHLPVRRLDDVRAAQATGSGLASRTLT